MSNDKLEITKEKVLEAASKCPQAKETLKTLFPDVFDRSVDTRGLIPSSVIRNNQWDGPYRNKSFILDRDFNWKILFDNQGFLILVPTTKN